jgi:hypothetical protein
VAATVRPVVTSIFGDASACSGYCGGMRIAIVLAVALVGCGVPGRGGGGGPPGFGGDDLAMLGGNPGADLAMSGNGNGQEGCGEVMGCYTVYAHSDHVLYRLDLPNKLIITIGPFNAPKVAGKEDSITDLAVATDGTIYVISKTNLYTADRKSGQVTLVSPVQACGGYAVALTFTADGKLYAGDHLGAFCRIDLGARPPAVIPLGMVGGNQGLAGDLVAVADGTMFGTVYTIGDTNSEKNNTLVTINPATGAIVKTIGATGFPRLFGIAFSEGQVFGFTGDGSGDVVTIDPKSGKGTLYGSFQDPATGKAISFGGAGVNAMVPLTIM